MTDLAAILPESPRVPTAVDRALITDAHARGLISEPVRVAALALAATVADAVECVPDSSAFFTVDRGWVSAVVATDQRDLELSIAEVNNQRQVYFSAAEGSTVIAAGIVREAAGVPALIRWLVGSPLDTSALAPGSAALARVALAVWS